MTLQSPSKNGDDENAQTLENMAKSLRFRLKSVEQSLLGSKTNKTSKEGEGGNSNSNSARKEKPSSDVQSPSLVLPAKVLDPKPNWSGEYSKTLMPRPTDRESLVTKTGKSQAKAKTNKKGALTTRTRKSKRTAGASEVEKGSTTTMGGSRLGRKTLQSHRPKVSIFHEHLSDKVGPPVLVGRDFLHGKSVAVSGQRPISAFANPMKEARLQREESLFAQAAPDRPTKAFQLARSPTKAPPAPKNGPMPVYPMGQPPLIREDSTSYWECYRQVREQNRVAALEAVEKGNQLRAAEADEVRKAALQAGNHQNDDSFCIPAPQGLSALKAKPKKKVTSRPSSATVTDVQEKGTKDGKKASEIARERLEAKKRRAAQSGKRVSINLS